MNLALWGMMFICVILYSGRSGFEVQYRPAKSAVAPITHPPLRCLLAGALALMQITGIYEGYFVRCGVETIPGNPIPH